MTSLLFLVALLALGVYLYLTWRVRGELAPVPAFRAIAVLALFFFGVVEGSAFLLDFAWWRELGQLPTFWAFLRIRWLPETVAAFLAAILLWSAFQLGRRWAGPGLARTRLFGFVGQAFALLLGVVISLNVVDAWTIVLYRGARDTGIYTDPLFHRDLAFYFFRLPFYRMVFAWAACLAVAGLAIVAACVAVGATSARWADLRRRFAAQMEGRPFAMTPLAVASGARASLGGLVRAAALLVLAIFAVAQYFARYDLLTAPHAFIYGADYVDVRWGLPLLWVQIAGAGLLMLLVAVVRRREKILPPARFDWLPEDAPAWMPVLVAVAFALLWLAPPLVQGAVRALYVRPNELTLERPYIASHIAATRRAFGLEQSSHEEPFQPRAADTLDLSQFPETASNLRLWDTPEFLDNISQLQALRPYYEFPNADVDRYPIDGATRQVLVAARSLDTSRLAVSAQSWVNLNIQYTHGYGAVAAPVNSATDEGQPELALQNAPPQSSAPALAVTRPELYFDETAAPPVFVDTSQPEFDYPKGDDNSYTTYAGTAGIPIGKLGWRIAAAFEQDDPNVLLTHYFTAHTRLLLHRQVLERASRLAPFLTFDPDPYLVIAQGGRLFWMLDAYTTSDLHPYAEPLSLGDDEINYIRNSVKVTVDAYNGTVHMYVFDRTDPILADYQRVFPGLFQPRSAMPADLLAHIRYPRLLFQAQAETYRLYHMQDPQVFYNKEDQWDVARQVQAEDQSAATAPYYTMLRLPGETQPEFALLLPFTSHGRDNLIAWLAARCDPAHYGQIVFYRLPKDQLIYGPLQIQSRVDQDRDISKDLSLWNQQGSRVIRGTTLVLPVDNTFLYLEPIYIQATQARMPELKKVVLALGDRIVYSDDLDEAMASLAQQPSGEGGAPAAGAPPVQKAGILPALAVSRSLLEQISRHFERYKQLTATGDYAQAGQELQAIEQLLQQNLGPVSGAGH